MTSTRNRSAKFIELANKRVNKTIKDIRLIGNLSNRASYSYDDVQAKKIIRVLQKELDILKTRFTGAEGDSEDLFKL
jgi:hypothetical protein